MEISVTWQRRASTEPAARSAVPRLSTLSSETARRTVPWSNARTERLHWISPKGADFGTLATGCVNYDTQHTQRPVCPPRSSVMPIPWNRQSPRSQRVWPRLRTCILPSYFLALTKHSQRLLVLAGKVHPLALSMRLMSAPNKASGIVSERRRRLLGKNVSTC